MRDMKRAREPPAFCIINKGWILSQRPLSSQSILLRLVFLSIKDMGCKMGKGRQPYLVFHKFTAFAPLSSFLFRFSFGIYSLSSRRQETEEEGGRYREHTTSCTVLLPIVLFHVLAYFKEIRQTRERGKGKGCFPLTFLHQVTNSDL